MGWYRDEVGWMMAWIWNGLDDGMGMDGGMGWNGPVMVWGWNRLDDGIRMEWDGDEVVG